jgi:hypothetical protein
VIAMAGIAETRFVDGLLAKAKAALKLRPNFVAPSLWATRTAGHLTQTLRPFRRAGLLPDYPMGSDFTPEEERLAKALGWLALKTATPMGKLRTALSAVLHGHSDDREALRRMRLDAPRSVGQWIEARLVGLGLVRTHVDAA